MNPANLATQSLSDTEMVEITVQYNDQMNNVIPTTIKLDFSYFQKTASTKVLIKASISFEDYLALDDQGYYGTKTVPYKLVINYNPLSHKELVVSFALDWHFYMVLYFLIGFSTVLIVGIFTIYHRFVSNATKSQTIGFSFFTYFKLNMPPAFFGCLLALIPLTLFIVILAFT